MIVEATGPVKFAAISTNASADLVAAVTGMRIRVLAVAFTVTTAAGTVKFQSGADSDLTGAFLFAAQGQLNLPFNPCGWFQTVAGEKLNAVLATAGQVSGCLVYQEVK